MKKLAILMAALGLVLSACGSGSNQVAATVDGTDITVAEVEGLIDLPEGEEVTDVQFADLLSFAIVLDVFTRGAEGDFGISFTEEEISTEADEIIGPALTGEQTREEILAERQVTEDLLQKVAHQSLLRAAVVEEMLAQAPEPTQEEIDAFLQESASLMVCGSHILVETEEEAQDVLDRLESGDDFAEVAAEVSLDGSGDTGGDLGCTSPDQYVPEFAEAISNAEVGVPTGPVETQFGFHVILLREDEGLPTEEQAIASLKDQSAQSDANDWFLEKAGAAEVTVAEEHGTWETDPTPSVVPPTGSTTTTTG